MGTKESHGGIQLEAGRETTGMNLDDAVDTGEKMEK